MPANVTLDEPEARTPISTLPMIAPCKPVETAVVTMVEFSSFFPPEKLGFGKEIIQNRKFLLGVA